MAAPRKPSTRSAAARQVTAPLDFKIKKRPKKAPIAFTLEGDDHVYQYTPQKMSLLVIGAATGSEEEAITGTLDWLSLGLEGDDEDRIMARLRDPKDDLDFPDLMEVIKGLAKAVSGDNPTG